MDSPQRPQTAPGQRFVTRGGSMFPFIPAGSLLTVVPTPAETLRAGDVIVYLDDDGHAVAHRLLIPPALLKAMPTLRVAGDRSGHGEDVPLTAYIGRADLVQWRRLTYKTRSLAGQLMSRIATRHRRTFNLVAYIAQHLAHQPR